VWHEPHRVVLEQLGVDDHVDWPQCEFDSVRVRALEGRTMAWVNSSAVCTTSTNIALITPLPQSALPQALCHRRLPDSDDSRATIHRTARPLTEIKQQDP
jgi:hypothetical protein